MNQITLFKKSSNHLRICAVVLMLCLAGCGGGIEATSREETPFGSLPVVKPFAKVDKTARQDPKFKVMPFPAKKSDGEVELYQQPSFTVGNKVVYVRKIDDRDRADRDHQVTVYIDNKEVGRLFFWGSYPMDEGHNSGYPFSDIEGAPAKLDIDKQAQTVTYRKPYLTPAGKRAEFHYTLRSRGDSQVELSWDLGVSEDEVNGWPESFGVSLWFTMGDVPRDQVVHFGEEEFPAAPREELLKEKVTTEVSGDFALSPDKPLLGYSLQLGERKGWVTESLQLDKLGRDRFGWITRFREAQRATEGQVVIDLGQGAVPQEGVPDPVAGHDFWKIDGIHVPVSPVRNVWPNPSFEQGLRYWKWAGGGATYTPGEGNRFETVSGGKFGGKALRVNHHQFRSAGLQSLPLVLEDGQTYTFSFYAKAEQPYKLNVAFASAAKGGKFGGKYGIVFGDSGSPEATYNVTTEWQRFTRTFVADGAGLTLLISGSRNKNTLIDGLQLEKGAKATEFISAPLDGVFLTSHPDNTVEKGDPLEAAIHMIGEPGTSGNVAVSIKNPYREVLHQERLEVTLPETGEVTLPLSVSAQTLGEGVFAVRLDYDVPGVAPYTEYHRFSIMASLSNTHATKDIFGTMTKSVGRIGRGDDYGNKLRAWGFGSTSWGVTVDEYEFGAIPAIENKYGISNFFNTTIPRNRPEGKTLYGYKKWTEVTPEMEKLIEEEAYQKVKRYDAEQYYTWHFGNEEESSSLPGSGRFDEYFKAQSAAARGAKRANPKVIFAPTNGTSGYSRLRGYDAIEGYLAASNRHDFKYDAVSVHPYWNIDKGTLSDNDLDEETARLVEQMSRYGYGKETPIYFTECFNVPETYFPAWGARGWADNYKAGKLSYDFGNREFIQAASAARLWIIALKYWPQVRSTNIWLSQLYIDHHLTPLVISKAANTLGHLMPDVEYVADIKPMAGVRGYSFKLKDGTGIAAIWCMDHDVENGLKTGPELEVKFDQEVVFYDLMGTPRGFTTTGAGITPIPLTPAPLFIKAGDVDALTRVLLGAETNDATSALSVAIAPSLDGEIYAQIRNLTGREQAGRLSVGENKTSYTLAPEERRAIALSGEQQAVEFGKLYRWSRDFSVKPKKGEGLTGRWNMDYFYVPKVSDTLAWSQVPSIEMTNRRVTEKSAGAIPEGDQKAFFKMAWDEANLYLRVEVEDDQFVFDPEIWKRPTAGNQLWLNDGCLEVYFDTAADARSRSEKNYDNNDYRYDFSISRTGQSGPGEVNRFRAVNHQLAQGLDMPDKEEVAEKVACDFQRTEKGYIYTITFAQRYLEPLMLEKGFISGFALYLHDKDDTNSLGCPKGLSLATEPGVSCDYKPYLWPLMILVD